MTQVPQGGPTQALAPLEAWRYAIDVWERSVLFWDVMRQRADDMLEHERKGLPVLLDFKYEMILDARRFEHPANYALLRITEAGGTCAQDCAVPGKPPVVVVDPRAGHGPGIGGFKRDSEVGIAMREGHTVYFVAFFPQPEAAQTLADVHHALRRFVAEVARRHPGQGPVLYGNCQAGWAVALLSADCVGLVGAAVLNGSPLSYWGGESGVNPMRVAGGLLGGAWLAHLSADLGNGRFDGAWLAQNFENLKPEKAIWEKYAGLFHAIDTQRDRFLEFERWWNGFYFLGREEILAIARNLFIGNQLEQGIFRICEGCIADLRRIRNPLVIFASHGDNITPPHQALGWIPAVYADTGDLKRAGQRIVYLINPHVGHYKTFASPWVQALANPWSAQLLEWLHPMRASRHVFAGAFNPSMRGVELLAQWVAAHREPLAPGSRALANEAAFIAAVGSAFEAARTVRDAGYEAAFSLLYGTGPQASAPPTVVPAGVASTDRRRTNGASQEPRSCAT